MIDRCQPASSSNMIAARKSKYSDRVARMYCSHATVGFREGTRQFWPTNGRTHVQLLYTEVVQGYNKMKRLNTFFTSVAKHESLCVELKNRTTAVCSSHAAVPTDRSGGQTLPAGVTEPRVGMALCRLDYL